MKKKEKEELLVPHIYRISNKQHLKVIRTAQKKRISEAQVVRSLIDTL